MDRRRLLLVVAAVIAALGVGLVFVYAQGAEKRASEKYDAVEVLTVAPGKTIEPGESLEDAVEAGKIVKAPVTQNQLLEGASDESDPFQGSVALTTIYAGEQLIPAKFGGTDEVEAAATLPLPKGKIAISIEVTDDGRVGKFLSPGAEVAVIFTDLAGSEPVATSTLLERVTVLAAGTTTTLAEDAAVEDSATAESEGTIQQLLTIAVTQREAEQVRFAEKDGELTAALLNDASEVRSDKGVTKDNLLR